jgi:gamma-glutamylcyclotransferase (GGCT)/AIG2-like uncharacterized protein YtfP
MFYKMVILVTSNYRFINRVQCDDFKSEHQFDNRLILLFETPINTIMQRLFVYGTLEFPAVVKKLLGTTLTGERAELDGYGRYLLVNRNYPGIVNQPGACVDGILYHGVTPKYFKLLDRYEDDIYERRQIQVRSSQGQRMNAWAYVIPLWHKHELSRQPWDREMFANTQLRRFLNVRCS